VEVDPTRMCELLVGLGDVEVLGIDVDLATFGWGHWHNTVRIHRYLNDISPDEYETAYTATTTDHNTSTLCSVATTDRACYPTKGRQALSSDEHGRSWEVVSSEAAGSVQILDESVVVCPRGYRLGLVC